MTQNQTFHAYFKDWMTLYKQGAVRPVTYQKYVITHQHLVKLAPRLKTSRLSRATYQQLLNDFAQNHERQTVLDFHHHLKSSIIDAMEEDILKRDPTRKIVIKGTVQRLHKPKFLNQFEVQALLKQLNLQDEVNWDYFILLITKTGLRFAEALGLTPADFDFENKLSKLIRRGIINQYKLTLRQQKIIHRSGEYKLIGKLRYDFQSSFAIYQEMSQYLSVDVFTMRQ